MIDPTFTKVALCRFKNTNQYSISLFQDNPKSLQKSFEKMTGLCSCTHIDFGTVKRVKSTFNNGFFDFYFATNVPIKQYLSSLTEQFLKNLNFLTFQT